jgi:hypothetical protein
MRHFTMHARPKFLVLMSVSLRFFLIEDNDMHMYLNGGGKPANVEPNKVKLAHRHLRYLAFFCE